MQSTDRKGRATVELDGGRVHTIDGAIVPQSEDLGLADEPTWLVIESESVVIAFAARRVMSVAFQVGGGA